MGEKHSNFPPFSFYLCHVYFLVVNLRSLLDKNQKKFFKHDSRLKIKGRILIYDGPITE